jgi:hypothetical protein
MRLVRGRSIYSNYGCLLCSLLVAVEVCRSSLRFIETKENVYFLVRPLCNIRDVDDSKMK